MHRLIPIIFKSVKKINKSHHNFPELHLEVASFVQLTVPTFLIPSPPLCHCRQRGNGLLNPAGGIPIVQQTFGSPRLCSLRSHLDDLEMPRSSMCVKYLNVGVEQLRVLTVF